MIEGSLILKEALVHLWQRLKKLGFKKRNATFYRKMPDGNTILLAIQRSNASTKTEVKLTINCGVYSALLGSRLQEDPAAALSEMRAHWRERLSKGREETWLHANPASSADEFTRILLDAAEGLLPMLMKHSTDSALRDQWLSAVSPGLTGLQRLLYATILVNEIGPLDRLNGVVEELRESVRGSIHEGLVERELALSGVRVP